MKDRVTIALDRSARRIDADGRLHVAVSNISKANVCPYYGHEIPGWQALGLDADKVYQLYRDPEELARAAPSFNGVPLLDLHVPATADDHPRDRVVGALGTDAEFVDPYLRNSLVIWDAAAIAAIESGQQRELSCGYAYRPDMTPGSNPAFSWDGVMRDIVGNHVALVEVGRAGPDVLVGDHALAERAHDKLDTEERDDLSDEQFAVPGKRKLPIENEKHIRLAWDLLDRTEGLTVEEKEHAKARILHAAREHGMDISDWKGATDAAPQRTPAMSKRKARVADRLTAILAGDAAIKVLAALDEEMAGCDDWEDGDPDAMDETEEERKEREAKEAADKKGRDARRAKDKRAKDEDDEKDDEKDEKAMDAAIKSAVSAAMAQRDALDAAKSQVRPLVGEVTTACDSAEAVYKFALDALGYDLRDVPPAAYAALIRHHRPTERAPLAQDGATRKGLFDAELSRLAH